MSKQQMREAMPTVAQIVDDYREWLELGGKVIYAQENGHVIDRRTPEREVFVIPQNYGRPAGGWKK
jgi:hypothetical protein